MQGKPPDRDKFTLRALPVRPIGSGIVVNTSFYAVLWAASVWLFKAARGRVRWSRGQCRECGYSTAGLGEGALCPECGHVIGRRR